MYINKHWRVLTVGDGDLSFSAALSRMLPAANLVATVYDSKSELEGKYGLTFYNQLLESGVDVRFEVDVNNVSNMKQFNQQFDLVIFQFPLVPNLKQSGALDDLKRQYGQSFSINTLNRRLLRNYLRHSFVHCLRPDGARLAYISSKDVKPYIHWGLEGELVDGLEVSLLGKHKFDIKQFPGYQIRNVDRDKHVKDTQGTTYVYSDLSIVDSMIQFDLTPFVKVGHKGCDLCQAGPFATEQERSAHQQSKKHQLMAEFHQQWLEYLNNEGAL